MIALDSDTCTPCNLSIPILDKLIMSAELNRSVKTKTKASLDSLTLLYPSLYRTA